MRFMIVALLGLGLLTGCGAEQEMENVRVEAVEGGFFITDQSGDVEFVSKVEFSTEASAISSDACSCKGCAYSPETGLMFCWGCTAGCGPEGG